MPGAIQQAPRRARGVPEALQALARALVLMLVLLTSLAPLSAAAHLMPAGQGTLRIDRDNVYAVISLPVRALTGFDDDGDHLLSLDELNRHRDALQQQVTQLLDLRDGGQPGRLLFADLLIPHLHEAGAPQATAQVVAMRRYQWAAPVQALTLDARGLFTADTPALLLNAVKGVEGETAALSASQPDYRFFAGPLATLQRFVLLGAQHILQGLDHLLFLLTVLAAGAGWRYWLAMVTSFTAAHSLTLTLAVLGWVTVPAAVTEPLIALSIVLMALDNLRRSRALATARRSALVFACGLVHGLGFASALQELGGAARWLSLAGFNLGVELGQLAFVGGALGVLAIARRLRPASDGTRLVRAGSMAAALAGAALLAQRLLELA